MRTNDSAREVGERVPVVVLGMGNLLRRDEGLGVRALQRLEELYHLPPTVRVVDGGTLGLELVSFLEDANHALALDAVLSDEGPGALVQLSGDDVPAFLGMRVSPHEISLPDALAVARLRGVTPPDLVVIGLHPASVELGWELSDLIASRLDALVTAAVAVLRGWGVAVEPHEGSAAVVAHAGEAPPEQEALDA